MLQADLKQNRSKQPTKIAIQALRNESVGMHMASDHYFLELEPSAEQLRHTPHVVIVVGGFAGVHASAVAVLHGFIFSGRLGLLLWTSFTWP